MAEPLKNLYNDRFFTAFTAAVEQTVPDFDSSSFMSQIYDADWEDRALKERMRHITEVLKEHWYDDFDKNVETLLNLIPALKANGFKADSFEFTFLPDFIELYGLEHYKTAVNAFEQITQFVTCEFAVRPFIASYPQQMMAQMLRWSKHKHPMVRRLASEGCRPRLPWGMGIPVLKADPTVIMPILENLKADESETVRRSVANNLNDISKDHPDIVIDVAKKWKGVSQETDRLLKHACRTLLKQGNTTVLELFGFGATEMVDVINFQLLTPKVKIGEYLSFAFGLAHKAKTSSHIRLEYAIYYQKANGSLSKKVFKISEKEYPGDSITEINRRQSFKIITTRKFHLGEHQVAVIVNGKEFGKHSFLLM